MEGNDWVNFTLMQEGCVLFGNHPLKLSEHIPAAPNSFYLNLRGSVSEHIRQLLGQHMASRFVAECPDLLNVNYIVAIPEAAIPLAQGFNFSLCAHHNIKTSQLVEPLQKEQLRQGRRKVIPKYRMGVIAPGTAVLVDDTLVGGGSKDEAIGALEAMGIECVALVVVLNRGLGTELRFVQQGIRICALTTLESFVNYWLDRGEHVTEIRQAWADHLALQEMLAQMGLVEPRPGTPGF